MPKYKWHEQYEKLIREWITFESDCLTIWDFEDVYFHAAPRPPLPFVALSIISDVDVGGTNHAQTSTGARYRTHRRATIQIDVYAQTGHMSISKGITDSLRRDYVQQYFNDEGLAIQSVGDVADTTALQDTQHECRATVDVSFGYVHEKLVDYDGKVIGPYDVPSEITDIESEYEYSSPDGSKKKTGKLNFNKQ